MSYLKPAKTLPSYGIGVPPDHSEVCPSCRENLAQIFYNSNPKVRTNQVYPCKKCMDKSAKLHNDTKKNKWYEKQARGIFKHTVTGEDKVLDQRGNEIVNPYDSGKANEFGWMQSGHKNKHTKFLEKEGKL
ncbi:MAG: hypothetical protein KAX49_19860 [Halanaerobiales bacterium]|nr:hypothetical protein [Halanaerobiales bacterium]